MKPVNREAAARSIALFLEALGYDQLTGDLAGTPERVAEAFATELLSGEHVDLSALIRAGSGALESKPGLILVRKIAISTVCPHHLLPAIGYADVAYWPTTHVLGLGTVTKLANACARRLSLQEAIGERVVAALMDHGRASGAFCRVELLHTCLSARGSEQAEARLVTVAAAGTLAGSDAATQILLALGSAQA